LATKARLAVQGELLLLAGPASCVLCASLLSEEDGLMIIQSVNVQNFRSLKDIDVICEPLTVLVGSNGAGKSALL
jgi:hypothetical protein